MLRIAATCLPILLLASVGAHAKPVPGAKTPAKSAAKAMPQSGPGSALRDSAPSSVDSAAVHRFFLDGNFDPAIALLEANLKETRQYRHEDSVFIFKHLGVMYAAQYETREKGKYYMQKLLMVEPSAKIMEMYAGDMIYLIFRNIQDEFERNRAVIANSQRNAPAADSLPGPGPSQVAAEPSPRTGGSGEEAKVSGKKWIWAGAAVVTLAAGVGAYLLLTEQPPATVREQEVAF